jgi:hypothetical protein
MRNTLIKAGLFIGVTLMLSTAGYAQVSASYRAEIPFDFMVRNTAYSAGEYSIRPLGGTSSSGALTIVNRKNGAAQIIGLTQIGGDMRVEKGKLTFEKVNGVFALKHVLTPTFELKVKAPKGDGRLARNISKDKEAATVPLGQ